MEYISVIALNCNRLLLKKEEVSLELAILLQRSSYLIKKIVRYNFIEIEHSGNYRAQIWNSLTGEVPQS